MSHGQVYNRGMAAGPRRFSWRSKPTRGFQGVGWQDAPELKLLEAPRHNLRGGRADQPACRELEREVLLYVILFEDYRLLSFLQEMQPEALLVYARFPDGAFNLSL